MPRRLSTDRRAGRRPHEIEVEETLNDTRGRLSRQQARRQRRDRYTGILLAVLGAVVLAVAIYALNGHKGDKTSAAGSSSISRATTTITPSAKPTKAKTSETISGTGSGPALPSPGSESHGSDGSDATETKKVPLVVLNDTETAGLARNAGERFRNGGWTVDSTDNLPSGISDIVSTCAYYDPDQNGAKQAADALRDQFPTIKRVKERFDGLPDGPVVVVLTPDYSSN